MGVSIFSNTLLNLIGYVPVDTKTYESHSPSATVANFALETGAVVSDHIIVNPTVIEIEFLLTSRDIPGGVVSSSYGFRAALLYNLLVVQLESRSLYTVLTRHKLYTNMAFTELPAEHTGPYVGQLIGRAKMQQVSRAALSDVTTPQDQLSGDSAYQAASPTSNGTLLLRTANFEISDAIGAAELGL